MIELNTVLLISLLVFFIGIGMVFIGAISQMKFKNDTNNTPFTLIIPAKDEAKLIGRCLDAISEQHYDLSAVQILVMNDQSSDNTSEIAETFISQLPNLEIISVVQDQPIIGKANAIDQGIAFAKNDIILICDADCAPNSNWFSMIIKQFDSDTGVVGGITLLDETKIKHQLFGIMQNIDWVFLLGTGSGAVGAGFPISCIGSNLAFRKAAYIEVGGYRNLPFSITEDLLLYKTIARKTKWKFKAPLKASAINWSIPMKDIKSLYRQRKRWLFGSFDLNFFGGILLMVAVIVHVMPLLLLAFQVNIVQSFVTLAVVFAIDFSLITRFLIALKQKKYIKFIPIYFLYYILNVIILPFILIFDRKVVWKDRIYNRKGHDHRI